ncbi:MAG: type IX secretion system sortase PorU [Bacteroidetes bacterium]|nr:type IX secretion system sortase PorU [Bacteroidota bacterium]
MKKTILALCFFACALPFAWGGDLQNYTIEKNDILNGYTVQKIWLQQYQLPKVVLSGEKYVVADALPTDAKASNPQNFTMVLGKERKRPFVLVQIPVYVQQGNDIKQLAGYTLDIEESSLTAETSLSKTTKTTASSSPLASGNWYKIAIANSGLYKVDYDFLVNKLGINPSSINTANFRVFGNGGNMVPENNAISHPTNLEEDAIYMHDGGDGTFNQGDYFLFYAVGPTGWKADLALKNFTHSKNIYEDKAYYFLTFDNGNGKRIASQTGNLTANTTVNTYNDYLLYENDINSPLKYGKDWWGEDFGTKPGKQTTRTITLDVGNIVGNAAYKIRLASQSGTAGTFNIAMNSQPIKSLSFYPVIDENGKLMFDNIDGWQWGSSGAQNITLNYQTAASDGLGYLDYIEVNMRRTLSFTSQSINFRDINAVGPGNIANYQLGNANGSTQVWDVTDIHNPILMNGSLSGNTYNFVQDAATLHEFTAFNSDQLSSPDYVGTVSNQNLHGLGATDLIIISYPDFVPAANELADFHRTRDNMKVVLATTYDIYNEFSSGSQDIGGLRDFIKMFYDNAGSDTTKMPRYVLLFGDASYDYKNRVAGNTNFVPTFESAESLDNLANYCGDDFFGFLDDNENIETTTNLANTLDVGVGRLPVKTLEEAYTMVNKIKAYKSPASLGPWRLSTSIIADNEDGAGTHMGDGEIMESAINSNSNLYNTTKVYEDALPFIATPGGDRCPQANKMINDQMYKGTFVLNYSGHGNTEVLSHERVITQDDYSKWTSLEHMPFSVTATCDFGQFDQPQFVSAGEAIILKKDGGMISSVTTVKAVFQSSNSILNRDYLDAQFKRMNGKWNTFGDALRIGKNKTYSVASTWSGTIINFRKFSLLGDPALTPDFPEYYIYTSSVADGVTGLPVSTISALGSYKITGYVGDINKNKLDNFNGKLSVVIYDKPHTISTIHGTGKTYQVRNNIIYKGKASVTDGVFSFAFIAPKDINYDMGSGKISYYAENEVTDAAGADFGYLIGGYSDHPVYETNAPVVRPYIGDSLFVDGGLTGSNTLLFAILEDETGINVSGNSVGHDLTGILDDDLENPYILNDYYETELNTYKRGYVNFPISNLAEGYHNMKVKAWDVNNNSGEGIVHFRVANGNVVEVQKLWNYPNPFTDITHFVFENNHPKEYMYGEINIYNMGGTLVKSLREVFKTGASRSNEITWDGTDENGAKLPSGVYFYRLRVVSDNGQSDSAYQKLVLVR